MLVLWRKFSCSRQRHRDNDHHADDCFVYASRIAALGCLQCAGVEADSWAAVLLWSVWLLSLQCSDVWCDLKLCWLWLMFGALSAVNPFHEILLSLVAACSCRRSTAIRAHRAKTQLHLSPIAHRQSPTANRPSPIAHRPSTHAVHP